jgi:hypothetical protein
MPALSKAKFYSFQKENGRDYVALASPGVKIGVGRETSTNQ